MRNNEVYGDMTAWIAAHAGDNESDLMRLKRNLRLAREEELTARQRELLRLRYEENMTVTEIAAAIGGLRHGITSYLNNVDKANEYLHTDLFRPPHGWMKWDQYVFVKRRYKVVMWDLVTRDYSTRLNGRDVLLNVRRFARPGSIITFHDSVKSHDKLLYALPRAIEWLLSQGYSFKVFE